jgi:hypothetical protein
MPTADPMLRLAGCCLNNGHMPADWKRLADVVIARRVDLGHKFRPSFSEATGFGLRTLGDIETARRDSYDRGTISALEKALGWATGSVTSVLTGGEPIIAAQPQLNGDGPKRRTAEVLADPVLSPDPDTADDYAEDPAIVKVMRSDRLTEGQKQQIVKALIAEMRRAQQQRLTLADEMMQLLNPDGQ